jgi:quercetin dioxygenase-like cupin family protein
MYLRIIASLLAVTAVLAAQQAASKPQSWDAKSIVWQQVDKDGTKWAVLEGRMDVPGEQFTYAFFLPAGHWEHHWHIADARVAVLHGKLKVAFGDHLDKASAKEYGVGTFIYVPANLQHTMGAEVDTIVIGTAKAPWKTHYHHAHPPAKP